MTTWWSKTILWCGVVALLLLPVAALGSRFGVWEFTLGFGLMQLGVVAGLVCVLGGIPGVVIARRRSLSRDLWGVVGGMALGFAVVLYFGMQALKAFSVPPIHQVSTNTADPPAFIDVVALRGEDANPLGFDAAATKSLQEEHYPWVEPLLLRATPGETFAKVQSVLAGMGLEVVAAHPGIGLIEAVDTTFWFGFKDDVAVRVREYPQGVVIDVRSVSRVGQSDLGANAERVKNVLRHLGGDSH